jgi:macrodomain Ter protein organizer (MatP/YcbG family)
MARTVSALDAARTTLAVAYLKRALRRKDAAIFVAPSRAAAELAKVEAAMVRLGAEETPGQFRLWVIEHLSPTGRVKMLNALRRKKADVKPDRTKRRTLTVSADTYRDLDELAGKTGVPLATLLRCLASIANADKALRDKLFTLAVAIKSTKP